jgi:hypothetical protein
VPGSALPDSPAVTATARDLGAALVGRCQVPAPQVRVIVDPGSPAELAQAPHESAAAATDVLVFAYIGHGLGVPSGELYLAGHGTADLGAELTYQALAFRLPAQPADQVEQRRGGLAARDIRDIRGIRAARAACAARDGQRHIHRHPLIPDLSPTWD